MSLQVFPGPRVIKLQSPKTSTGHKHESDILNFIDVFVACVLDQQLNSLITIRIKKITHTEYL